MQQIAQILEPTKCWMGCFCVQNSGDRKARKQYYAHEGRQSTLLASQNRASTVYRQTEGRKTDKPLIVDIQSSTKFRWGNRVRLIGK